MQTEVRFDFRHPLNLIDDLFNRPIKLNVGASDSAPTSCARAKPDQQIMQLINSTLIGPICLRLVPSRPYSPSTNRFGLRYPNTPDKAVVHLAFAGQNAPICPSIR